MVQVKQGQKVQLKKTPSQTLEHNSNSVVREWKGKPNAKRNGLKRSRCDCVSSSTLVETNCAQRAAAMIRHSHWQLSEDVAEGSEAEWQCRQSGGEKETSVVISENRN